MSFHPYTSQTAESCKKHIEIEDQRKKLLEDRMKFLVERTENPPSTEEISDEVEESELIAAVHEDLALRQMRKAFNKGDSKKFWENQKRFLEFIELDMDNPFYYEKGNLGYKFGHAWFLNNNLSESIMGYAFRFLDISPRELRRFRTQTWKEYNGLCKKRNEIDRRYCYHCLSDLILMPVSED